MSKMSIEYGSLLAIKTQQQKKLDQESWFKVYYDFKDVLAMLQTLCPDIF